jgi:leucine-rich repeat-containing protein 49
MNLICSSFVFFVWQQNLNPERMNLDNRNFLSCPVLEGEQRLRLLNMQNNCIQRIENMVNLPSLIFLDLYNNQISELSGLETIPTLRVLMLGLSAPPHIYLFIYFRGL